MSKAVKGLSRRGHNLATEILSSISYKCSHISDCLQSQEVSKHERPATCTFPVSPTKIQSVL